MAATSPSFAAEPNALNSNIGLIWLEPDERWSSSWRARYEATEGDIR